MRFGKQTLELQIQNPVGREDYLSNFISVWNANTTFQCAKPSIQKVVTSKLVVHPDNKMPSSGRLIPLADRNVPEIPWEYEDD